MMNKEEIIMYDADDIVEYRTNIEGWVDKNGRYWGNDENIARYSSCTHTKCECGDIMTKGWSACESCRDKNTVERYNKLEYKEWDGKTPIALYDNSTYFFDEDELRDYCDINQIKSTDNLMLVLCSPMYVREVDEEYWDDFGTEDNGVYWFYPSITDKVNELNKMIRELPPMVWEHDKYRTKVVLNLHE